MKPAPSLALALLLLLPASSIARADRLTAADVNAAELAPGKGEKSRALLVKAQVLLDRAGFSPGVIDGRKGENFTNALQAYQKQNGIREADELDEATWKKLTQTSNAPVLKDYTIAEADVKGPFEPDIPDKLEEKAKLKRLAYTGPQELLAEKFHMDEELLAQLNPGKKLDAAGTAIAVANVTREPPKAKVGRIEVDKPKRLVRAFAEGDKLVAVYPASIGSEEKPAPSGTFKIVAIARNPTYVYDPEFQFKGVKAKEKFTVPPGPNNPVGAVWMSLNEKSYGIHGTPDPETVGKAASHGCVRLTNWDALALAAMVRKGTVVQFID
jgi:lipoprotein-anchoring transpeptidase ErfK/SrfK